MNPDEIELEGYEELDLIEIGLNIDAPVSYTDTKKELIATLLSAGITRFDVDEYFDEEYLPEY